MILFADTYTLFLYDHRPTWPYPLLEVDLQAAFKETQEAAQLPVAGVQLDLHLLIWLSSVSCSGLYNRPNKVLLYVLYKQI